MEYTITLTTDIVSELIKLFLNSDISLPVAEYKPPINSHIFSITSYHSLNDCIMSTQRKLPAANIGCETTMETLQEKHDSVLPADSAISPATAGKLATTRAAFSTAMAGVTAAEEVQRLAKEAIDIDRVLLHDNISVFITSLNSGIKLKLIPNSARSYFGLDVSNKKLPDINTDIKLNDWAKKIVTGDAARVDNGGIVITFPTTVSFTGVYTHYKASFKAFSTAKSDLTTAQTAVNNLRPEVDKLIVHAWNEIENNFSELPPPALRAASRPWSVKYISNGDSAVVSGKCIDSITHLPIAGLTVHLDGSNAKVITDALGNFTLTTTMYGDMELIITAKDYKDNSISFTMLNGVNTEVNVVMINL